MKAGTILLPGVIYYTKNGQGKIVKFNEGVDFRTGARVPITPELTHTDAGTRPVCRYRGLNRLPSGINFFKKTAMSTQKIYIPGKWQRAKIVKHTPLLFGNNYVDAWHRDSLNDIIEVREPGWQSAYYESHTGDSILKADVELLHDLER